MPSTSRDRGSVFPCRSSVARHPKHKSTSDISWEFPSKRGTRLWELLGVHTCQIGPHIWPYLLAIQRSSSHAAQLCPCFTRGFIFGLNEALAPRNCVAWIVIQLNILRAQRI